MYVSKFNDMISLTTARARYMNLCELIFRPLVTAIDLRDSASADIWQPND